jgi:hypothetical protein
MSAPVENKNLLQRRQYKFKSENNPFLNKGVSTRCKKKKINFCYLSKFATGFSYWIRAEHFTVYSLIPSACAECNHSSLFSGTSSIPLCYIPFSNYYTTLPHFNLSSISWSTSKPCFQIHTYNFFRNSIFFHSLYMVEPM